MSKIFGSQEQPTDRRSRSSNSDYDGPDQRQFRDSHCCARPEVTELAQAVDQYKLHHRRRFITYEELYNVFTELGYSKSTEVTAVDCV
ncbi:MAG: hypothetical protein JKY95_10255 [Planctomycetaceae bacterium]|nr:hypothetical protein [Planctomycetaceae bacterium]